MTYYGANELAASLRVVRKNTVQIAEDIPEAQYGFRPSPDCRSVAELLAHIALGYQFQKFVHAGERRTTLAGIDFMALIGQFKEAEAKLTSKAQIIDALKNNGEAWASWIDGLSEEFLAERVQMPARAALQQEPLRDAAVHQGARDAPSRSVDGVRAPARYRASPDPRAPGARAGPEIGPDVGRTGVGRRRISG